ncbi:hypothetical protein GHK86_07865, partial [Acidimicrobiaceae bacterium USS-CC1]|nr:hypothetical protein [Acidiferrimicrobium australe]
MAERTGAQRLRVGFWRHVRYGRVLAEGVIVGDVLSAVEKEAVGSWAAATRSTVARPSTRDRFLQVHSERAFVAEILYRRAIRGRPYRSHATQRDGLARGATIVCWDAAFVLSRFCLYESTALSGVYRGGLSMALAGRPAPAGSGRPWQDRPGFPRLLARQLNPEVTMVGWAGDRLMVADGVLPGWVVDLGHLGRTLTGGGDGGFAGFCAAFGVDEPGSAPAWQPGDPPEGMLRWGRARLDAEIGLHEAFMGEVDTWRDGGARRVRPPWLYSGGG